MKPTVLSALLATALMTAPLVLQAQPVAQIKTQAPGYYRMMLGKFEITVLSDGTATLPMDKLLQRVAPQTLQELFAAQALTPQVETSANAFLINTGEHLALVDTGAGPLLGNGAGKLLASLQAAGYAPQDIDTVLITHLHPDHFGGLTRDGKLLFPNATVYVNKADVDYWLNPANLQKAPADERSAFATVEDFFKPVIAADKLKTFSGEQQLLPGIHSVAAAGHTPGHTLYRVESEGESILMLGDTIHAIAVQMPLPQTTISFDKNMDEAAQTRAAVLADAAKKGYWVAGAHISFPGIGHVMAQKTTAENKSPAYYWVPVNYSLSGL